MPMQVSDWIQAGVGVVLFLTFLAIIWYAWETRKLRLEAAHQTELQLRPFLVLELDKAEGTFIVRNVGNGIALKLKVADVTIGNIGGKVVLKFETVSMISVGEERRIGVLAFKDGEECDLGQFIANVDPKFANRDYILELKYNNLVGDAYKSLISTGKSGIDIKSSEKIR